MHRTLAFLVALGSTAASTAARADNPPPPPPPSMEAQPNWSVPAPTANPPPPVAYAQAQAAAPVYQAAPVYPATPVYQVAAPATGQWVYTQQYGWLWMPYDARYTSVTGPNVAFEYVFQPAYGWRWISAPWVLGIGVAPRWGHLGPRHYAWYGRPAYRPTVVRAQPTWVRHSAPSRAVVVRASHNGHGHGHNGRNDHNGHGRR
jgi:hypothetical protein